MKTIIQKMRTAGRNFIDDTSGSEVVEMVYACGALCMLILSVLLIIGYALQVNAVSYAGKRVVRYVEVTGQAKQSDLQDMLESLLANAEDIEAKVEVTRVDRWANESEKKINLRDKFTITVTAVYKITLINPGGADNWDFNVPIRVSINGQSEKYWKNPSWSKPLEDPSWAD